MRQTFARALQDIDNISAHKEVLTTTPSSPHQYFVQTIGNILMCNQKQAVGDLLPLLSLYKGSYSSQILNLKYCTYCMEKDKSKTYSIFTTLKMLSKWVVALEGLKKKKDVRLYPVIVEDMELGLCTYEEFIVYLNYIANDVLQIIKSGTDESRKKYSDLSKHPHLDAHDLTRLLVVILPRVLINMIIPRNFFPPTLLRASDEAVVLLYSNQCYENIAQSKPHYVTLVRTIMKCLLSMELESSQCKELVLSAIKYFYLYHHDKNYGASQLVIESFKKMTTAVRFALMDQIILFVSTIRKIGKQLFISYLGQKFEWISEMVKNNTKNPGVNKATLKPFGNQSFGNSLKIKVEAGKTEQYFIEIFDRFSLVYFCIKCIQHDITIRLYYLGDFAKGQGLEQRKLLISSQKKQGIFEGSVQTIEKGLYMFQFDNSYAWMKAKSLTFDLSILVPIEIREHKKDKLKQLVFEKSEHLNEVPYQNVVGWVDENEIRLNSTSANISCVLQGNVKVYNVKLIRNTGQAYEYETESKSRFLRKLKTIEKDPNLFWLIDGFKIKGVSEVQRWLQGDFHPEKQLELNNQIKEDINLQQEEFKGEENERQDPPIKNKLNIINQQKKQAPVQNQSQEHKQANLQNKKDQIAQDHSQKQANNSKLQEMHKDEKVQVQSTNQTNKAHNNSQEKQDESKQINEEEEK